MIPLKKGDFQNAIKYYSESMSLDPSNAILPANRAMAHLRLNKYTEALQDCDRAINLDEKFVKAYHRRGTARKHLGMIEAAIQDFEKGLQLDPVNKEIQNDLKSLKDTMLQKQKTTNQTVVKKEAPQSEAAGLPPTVLPDKVKVNNVEEPKKLHTVVPSKENSQRKKKDVDYIPVSTAILGKPKVPKEPPKSAYEFENIWNNLRNDLPSLYEYVKLINPSTLSALFKDAMSSDIFDSLLHIIEQHFLPQNPKGAFEMLSGLFQVNRIHTLLLFLSKEEKQVLQTIFAHLSSTYGEEQLSVLKAKCRL